MANKNDRPPVIFLAFANDKQNKTQYLRHLSEEANSLRETLTQAEAQGLCEVVYDDDLMIREVIDIFQDERYTGRIAIFHFGGHANSYQLLMESDDGAIDAADAAGFAAFLGQQPNLKLVFLNACSTQPQVEDLLEAGVAAVLATSQAIDDQIATNFSNQFYQLLAAGSDIQAAFNEAVTQAKNAKSGNTRGLFYGDEEAELADRWPWELHLQAGFTTAGQWNLPDAVDNPLFRLPPLPHDLPLPDRPFRYLEWFTRDSAHLFFGRGYQIRALYRLVTDANAAPVILLYGQSGVGKSSLLDAGLRPRLGDGYTVRYLRRAAGISLSEALVTGLPLSEGDIGQAWFDVEREKPLVLILDQVEEAYTNPTGAADQEVGELMAMLYAIFGDPERRPKGKIILGFRKEWLGPIEKRVQEHKIHHHKIYVEPLDKRGIIEAISGITQTKKLQDRYGLKIDEELPAVIADDLLEDHQSAIAPTLQVLLTKMWNQAKTENSSQPHFSLELYQTLKDEGYLLGDFLDQQLATLEKQRPEAAESGLPLDLLLFFTTQLGTAIGQSMAAIEENYRHCGDQVEKIIQDLIEGYLLVQPDQSLVRLAHDALAPIVRQRFNQSERIGQRARRIIESRMREGHQTENVHPLNRASLEIVEAGRSGMRALTAKESDLISRSKAARERFIAKPLTTELFPKNMMVKKFVPEQELAVIFKPTTRTRHLWILFGSIIATLILFILSMMTFESNENVAIGLFLGAGLFGFVGLYNLIDLMVNRFHVISFDLHRQIVEAPNESQKDSVKYSTITEDAQKVGILSYGDIEFCQSEPAASEVEVADQLVPFYLALNAALGHKDVVNPFQEME